MQRFESLISRHFRKGHRPSKQGKYLGLIALVWLAMVLPTYAQIPPLSSVPPDTRIAKKPLPGLFETPFARRVMGWGQTMRKQFPKEWEFQWSSSRLRGLRWMASHQQGYRIRFAHRTHKVIVPVPFPTFGPKQNNMKKIYKRCSLHFFPRKGRYSAHHSLIARLPPARLITVTADAIVLQPDRFQAAEYPCPKLLKRFRRFAGTANKGRRWRKKIGVRAAWLTDAKRHRYHLEIKARSSPESARVLAAQWKRWLQRARVRTLVVYTSSDSHNQIDIYHLPRKRRPTSP